MTDPLWWWRSPAEREATERAIFAAECAARPPTDSVSTIIRMAKINRFESQMDSEYRGKPHAD